MNSRRRHFIILWKKSSLRIWSYFGFFLCLSLSSGAHYVPNQCWTSPFYVAAADEVERKDKIRLKDSVIHTMFTLTSWHFRNTAVDWLVGNPHRRNGKYVLWAWSTSQTRFSTKDKKKIADINLRLERERKCFVSI